MAHPPFDARWCPDNVSLFHACMEPVDRRRILYSACRSVHELFYLACSELGDSGRWGYRGACEVKAAATGPGCNLLTHDAVRLPLAFPTVDFGTLSLASRCKSPPTC